MMFIQRNDVIEQFAARTAHPSFGDAVLSGTANAPTPWLEITRLQEGQHLISELSIMIEQDVFIRTRQGKGFTQSLHDSLAGGMTSDVELQNLTLAMFDDEEAVQRAKAKGRNREEVECRDHLTMIVQESEPLFGFALLRKRPQSLQIARHGGFRDLES
jgi:hypothetical protein